MGGGPSSILGLPWVIDCKLLAIYLSVGIVLTWSTNWLITRVIEPKVIKMRKRIGKMEIHEVVVGMISKCVGWMGSKATVFILAEAGVIGSSSPLKGPRSH